MLLKIRDFAALSHVSPRMLRHYAALGLFRPAWIDPASGYRYYHVEQLPQLRRLCVLRDLGFTVAELHHLLPLAPTDSAVRHLLEQKHAVLQQRIAADQLRAQRVAVLLAAFQQEDHPMTENRPTAPLAALLDQEYGIAASALTLQYPGASFDIYQIERTAGPPLMAACVRPRALADHIHTTWLSGYGGHTLADFLLSRAGLLTYLAARGYPTQQVVRTASGEPLGSHEGWCALVLTDDGLPIQQPVSPGTWERMGAALGRLHGLPLPAGESPALTVGQSWLYPPHALHEALRYIERIQPALPAHWHELIGQFHETLLTIQQAPLPQAIIHGDPFLDTARLLGDGTLTWRQWHSGGLGIAGLDLGRLLLGCHVPPNPQWPWTIAPDPQRIRAILAGYGQHRPLSALERRLLGAAIRFGIAYTAMEHLARALTTGWTPRLDQILTVRRQWWQASAEIAQVATAAVAPHP